MCCFFNKAYLRIPFDIIKQYKVILLYHCWNHVVFSFIVVKDAASHSTNYSLPPPLPSCLPPGYTEFYKSIITSPDSAPGADGIPFSAWRLSPSVSSRALDHHFTSILHMQTPPPLQSLVFIPKADKADYADNYRPLGLPNTCDRLIDRAAYFQFA